MGTSVVWEKSCTIRSGWCILEDSKLWRVRTNMSHYTWQKAVTDVHRSHFVRRILCGVAVIEFTSIVMLMSNGLVSTWGWPVGHSIAQKICGLFTIVGFPPMILSAFWCEPRKFENSLPTWHVLVEIACLNKSNSNSCGMKPRNYFTITVRKSRLSNRLATNVL